MMNTQDPRRTVVIVHATDPPHFTHARSTFDHPQPEFCKLRTGGRTKTAPKRIIVD